MNRELPHVQAGFRKGRGTRDQIANLHWIIKKAREFQKNIYCFLTMLKPLTVGSQQTGKIFKRWEYQTTSPASWEICMQVKKKQLELDMEQTGSKLGNENLAYMQSTSWEMPGWIKHKMESRSLGEISITSDMPMTPPLWQKDKN